MSADRLIEAMNSLAVAFGQVVSEAALAAERMLGAFAGWFSDPAGLELASLSLVADASVPRDRACLDLVSGEMRVHPLEEIRLINEGDPITELQEACSFVAERACVELDELEDRLRAEMETVRFVKFMSTSMKVRQIS